MCLEVIQCYQLTIESIFSSSANKKDESLLNTNNKILYKIDAGLEQSLNKLNKNNLQENNDSTISINNLI